MCLGLAPLGVGAVVPEVAQRPFELPPLGRWGLGTFNFFDGILVRLFVGAVVLLVVGPFPRCMPRFALSIEPCLFTFFLLLFPLLLEGSAEGMVGETGATGSCRIDAVML